MPSSCYNIDVSEYGIFRKGILNHSQHLHYQNFCSWCDVSAGPLNFSPIAHTFRTYALQFLSAVHISVSILSLLYNSDKQYWNLSYQYLYLSYCTSLSINFVTINPYYKLILQSQKHFFLIYFCILLFFIYFYILFIIYCSNSSISRNTVVVRLLNGYNDTTFLTTFF